MSTYYNRNSMKAKEQKEKTSDSSENSLDSLSKDNSNKDEQWFFKKALWMIFAVVLVFLFAFLVGFFFTLRGAEKTVIPQVEGMELVDGLIALQEKGLNPRVQVKYTQNSEDKGLVVEQFPSSGQHVRVGRQVTLTVSQGAIIESVGDYRGKTLDEVTLELQTVFASFQAMIQVGEVIYQYSDQPEGAVIAQDPPPGTTVTELTSLNLVISRGMEDGMYKVDNFTGMVFHDAILKLAESNTPFVFIIDEDQPAQRQSVVFRQSPAIGEMTPLGAPVELYVNKLSESAISNGGDDMVFKLFEYQLPVYMVPVEMRLERTVGTLDPVVVFETEHPGGPISFPYFEEVGTELSLFVNDKEIIRHHVQ